MKLLLLSDVPMSLSASGISQTLYNILCFLEPEQFLGVTPQEELKVNKPEQKYVHRYVGYKSQFVKTPRNRIGKYIFPVIRWINFSLCQVKSFSKERKQIKSFAPDVVVSCQNSAVGVLMHNKLVVGLEKKTVVYFMDDWMNVSNVKWLGGELSSQVGAMLRRSERWMMISKELYTILAERYQINQKAFLEVRNPVNLENAPTPRPYQIKDEFVIAYAGALWDMHFDSLLAFAKAIQLLKGEMSVKLIIYTAQSNWAWRKDQLEGTGAIYGGHVAYENIHARLNEADALLVASSFTEEWQNHSKASLQTKLTDYCKSRRLIISCGPAYSANHRFIKENNCGICVETNSPKEMARQLKKIIEGIKSYEVCVNNAWNVLVKDFSQGVVQRKVVSFLSQVL